MADTTETTGNEPAATPRVYTEAEVAELQGRLRKVNEEAKGHRLDRDKHKGEAERLAAELAAATNSHTEALTKVEQRAIRSELKAALAAAGAVDLDAVTFLKLSDAKLNADGDVENAAEMVAKLKEAKTYLFAAGAKPASSTSNPTTPPPQTAPAGKHARDMTPDERKAGLAKLIRAAG